MKFESKIPGGPLQDKWDLHKRNLKLVAPNNRRKYTILVIGSGLAGASAAASLGEMGYNVKVFCIQDSPRRAHSIAAQGGINAAKNYPNDNDSIWRLFHDTIKGGDYRAREGNVYRLAQVSNDIIDQCVAQGVPFARDYGGLLDNRSFGGAQVSRTFYARGQTGQQLLLGAYSALMRQVDAGTVEMLTRRELMELVTVEGRARGVVVRNLVTGELENYAGHSVLLCTGGYGNVFYLSTNAVNSNGSAAWRCYQKGAGFANPCMVQIHPTCIPVSGDHQSKLTLMSESLRNDGQVWVPKKKDDKRAPNDIPEEDRDYFLERRYPGFGNLVPRDVASRNAKMVCDEGRGVGSTQLAVYLDFAEAIERLGRGVIEERYGNLFEMYEMITGENPYEVPMRIFPAIHYTMGGLWVDYNLESTIPGLHVLGEANFSDHGANRLGASALMQGLADGYFVIPFTLADYLANHQFEEVDTNHPAFAESQQTAQALIERVLSINGTHTVRQLHRDLGHIMWDYVGMGRTAEGLQQAIEAIQQLRKQFWSQLKVTGDAKGMNKQLEQALRLSDYMEMGELMARDALKRAESCGGHFREESQTDEGEALRDDENFTNVTIWEYTGADQEPVQHRENLEFEFVQLTQRSYK